MTRNAEYPISGIFINRWSSRAFSDQPVTHDELMTLFEAARWAPSAYNDQPWRFVYANKGSSAWQVIFDALLPVNGQWAGRAPVLVVLLSKKIFDKTGSASHTNSFDAGAAWMSLALQASMNGLVVHAMGGVDYEKLRAQLHVPDDFKIEIVIAIGKPGNKDQLPENLQERETPNDRRPVHESVFEERFLS